MKFGFRMPSLKRSLKARTTGKLKRSLKKAINPLYGKKGMGLINDPSKAVYNKVYDKTTVGVSDIIKPASSNNSNQNYTSNPEMNGYKKPRKRMNVTLKTILWLVFFFPVGLYFMWHDTRWNKIVKIVITVFFALVFAAALIPDNDTTNEASIDSQPKQEEQTNQKEDTEKQSKKNEGEEEQQEQAEIQHPIKMKKGFDKLQSLYLQIDESYTEDELKSIAEDNGLYIETEAFTGTMEDMYISEKETTGYGEGAETWYTYDVDSIELTLTRDDSNRPYYAFTKDYRVQDKFLTVSYTFYDKDLYVENGIAGYAEGDGKRKEDFKSVKEALKYALNK